MASGMLAKQNLPSESADDAEWGLFSVAPQEVAMWKLILWLVFLEDS